MCYNKCMTFTKSQIVIIGIGVILFLFIALLFIGIVPGLRSNETPDISGSLTIWGTDDPAAIEKLTGAYAGIHPNVAITYTQMDEASFEEDVVEALAAGKGPDIFLIENSSVPKQSAKLSYLTNDQFPLARLDAEFPKAIETDLAFNASTTFALPLYLDTLVLFSNKDLLDNAGIATPPTTWESLEAVIPRLRQVDASQKILKSAIALGGSNKSVTRATEILTLIMLQDGVEMVKENLTDAVFANEGESSLAYYTNFANPGSPDYTWNDEMKKDIDAFASGDVAMMIGFAEDAELIKEKNPFLRFSISPMLQRKDAALAVNYPRYHAFAVPAASPNAWLAWDFVGTAALNASIMKPYLEETGRTPALRSLLAEQSENRETGFLAQQALTAKTWTQPDAKAVKKSFSDMISSVLTGKLARDRAIRAAQEEITDLLRKRFQDAL